MIKLILFFVAILAFFTHPFEGSGDFYHHVSTGKFIVEHRSLPYLDSFTHTANGLPWVAYSWASGLIFYLILKFFGEIGITVAVSLVALITFALLYLLLASFKIPQKINLLTILVMAGPISVRFPQRPEVFTYPLAISLLLIDKLRQQYPLLISLYPLIILLWANLYGGAVIAGLVILIILILKQLISDGFKIKRANKLFYLSCLASLPISLLNGYSFKSLFYLFLFIPTVNLYEGEWAGISKIVSFFPISNLLIYQYYILIYFLYLGIFLLMTAFLAKNVWKHKFFLLLSLGLIVPIFSLRHTPLAVILSSPLLATCLTYHLKHKRIILLGSVFLIGLFMLLISLWVNPPGLIRPQNQALIKMIDFIKDNKIYGNAFNHIHLGGFLSYRLYPNVLVFYDTRDELFLKTEALKDLYNAYASGKSVLPLLHKYQIDLVIADFITDGLNYRDIFYSPDWAIVFDVDRYFVAIPKRVARQKNLKELDFVDPFSQSGAKPGLEEKAAGYLQQINLENADLINNNLFLASSYLALGKTDQAIKVLLNIKINPGPTSPFLVKDLDYFLAQSYLDQGNCQLAKNYLDQSDNQSKKMFIIPTGRNIIPKVSKAKIFYQLKCQKDLKKAGELLNEFLSLPEISPLEKLRVQRQFSNQP